MNVQNEKIKHKKQGVNMNFEEEYKKLKEENENLKRLMGSFDEEKLKNAEEILEIVEDDTSFVELTVISEKMNLKNVPTGKIMKRFSEKYKDKIKKGYIKHEKMKRRIGFFGVKLRNEKINTQIRIDSVPQMKSKPQEMNSTSPENEKNPSTPELEHQDFEGRDIQKTEPKSEKFICDDRLLHLIMYKGYKMGIPKEVYLRDKCFNREKGWLIVDKYIIRDGDGNMSQLESTDPKFIQKIHGNAMNGVY